MAEGIVDIMDGSKILEMIYDGSTSAYNIENSPGIDIKELTKDDPNPMFANIEVIRRGVSTGNRREYNNDIVKRIAELIPGTIGYLGHPDPDKTSFEFRDPQSIYVGSKIEELADGGLRAIGKSYIFKNSPLREWLPKSIAAGNPLTVSINGVGSVIKDIANRLLHVQSIDSLDSIDWANPGTQGVDTAQAINIVSELKNEGGNIMPGEVMTKTPEIIRSVTLAEMKAYNGDVVDGVIRETSIAELQTKNPKLFEDIKNSGKITEMTIRVDGQDKTVKLTEMQGIIDGQASKIAELQGQIDSAKITEYKNSKIAELVPEQYREQVAKRVTGKTNTEIDTSITNEITYLKEMVGEDAFKVGPDNPPRGNKQHHAGDSMKADVRALFGVKEEKK